MLLTLFDYLIRSALPLSQSEATERTLFTRLL